METIQIDILITFIVWKYNRRKQINIFIEEIFFIDRNDAGGGHSLRTETVVVAGLH